ncbi:DUF6157 family protein [Chelatococcus sambhunathii]|nr:DUF6157 family protein [Chelatococcus sambhunathii]
MMHSTNYFNTLILVSPDCLVNVGTVPQKPGTIAAIQYDILSERPYQMTSDDLLIMAEARRKGVKHEKLAEFEKAYFSRPHACLRASPLVRSYGWGIHHDTSGRIALVGCETEEYARLVGDPRVRKVSGMRSSRA